MFISNKIEEEDLLLSWSDQLSSKVLGRLKLSEGYYFYKLIFSRIQESDFGKLYSTHPQSAPNSPVNCLLGAMFLQHKNKCQQEDPYPLC